MLLQLQRQNAQLKEELQELRLDQVQHAEKLKQVKEQHNDDIRRALVGPLPEHKLMMSMLAP